MRVDFLMPKLGADMIEGRVVEWLKKPGEPMRSTIIPAEIDSLLQVATSG